MLIVKKFGGTSVGDKERIMNVARNPQRISRRATMLYLSFPQWAKPQTS